MISYNKVRWRGRINTCGRIMKIIYLIKILF